MNWISSCDGGHCVEAGASLGDVPGVWLRSTLNPGERIFVTLAEWREFVAAIKNGDFDTVGIAFAEPCPGTMSGNPLSLTISDQCLREKGHEGRCTADATELAHMSGGN